MSLDPCTGQAWDSPLQGDVEMKEELEVYGKQEPLSPQNQGLAPLFLTSPQPDQPDTFTDDDPLAKPGSSKDL